MRLFFHPHTLEVINKLKVTLPQSLLLTGERGGGLATLARDLAGNELASMVQPLAKEGEVDATSGTISVEMIRSLYVQTRSRSALRRVIVIDDADRMSPAAQGAFLKLLEEPSTNTFFILTSHILSKLLPTVRSRLQILTVQNLTLTQTYEQLDNLGVEDEKKRSQLVFIAAGLPAELTRLSQDESYFLQRAEVMTDARDLLSGDRYKKVLITTKYQKDQNGTLQLLDSAITIARRSMSAKAQPGLIEQLNLLLTVRERVGANGNPRLQLLSFVL